jgi:hypothetical protein
MLDCIPVTNKRDIVNYGPSEVVVYDFDERISIMVTRFADSERLAQPRPSQSHVDMVCVACYNSACNTDCTPSAERDYPICLVS